MDCVKYFLIKIIAEITLKNLFFYSDSPDKYLFWLVECLLSHQSNTEKTSHPTPAPPPCPSCGSHHTIKNGSTHNGKPKRQCKDCGRQFVINPNNKTISPETKQLIDKLLLERISPRGYCESYRCKLVMVTKLHQQ